MKEIVRPLHAARELWRRIEGAVTTQSSTGRSSIKKRWKRSWVRKSVWPWLKSEVEVVLKVSGVITLSLWAKRIVEQLLGGGVVNQSVLRGEIGDIIRTVENDVEQRRPGHARTRE